MLRRSILLNEEMRSRTLQMYYSHIKKEINLYLVFANDFLVMHNSAFLYKYDIYTIFYNESWQYVVSPSFRKVLEVDCTQHWWGHTSSTVSSFGPPTTRRIVCKALCLYFLSTCGNYTGNFSHLLKITFFLQEYYQDPEGINNLPWLWTASPTIATHSHEPRSDISGLAMAAFPALVETR